MQFNKRYRQIRKFFKSKKIIKTMTLQPGELRRTFTHKNGKKYALIAFTNLVKFKGMEPTTAVLFSNITEIKSLPSPFKKWLWKTMGLTAKPITYSIQRSK